MGRLFFFAAILLFGHPPRIVASPDSEYLAKCTVNSTIEVICEMSFFSSHRNYDLTGQLYVDIGNDLCNLEIARQNVLGRSTGATILAVKRGGCAFDTKAIVAQALNFKALAIINFESTTFPAGSQDPNFQTKIPVVMVSSEFWTLVDLERESTATGEREREECAELSMTIKYGNPLQVNSLISPYCDRHCFAKGTPRQPKAPTSPPSCQQSSCTQPAGVCWSFVSLP